MAPSVKDIENPSATSAPAPPTPGVAKPQPVALEIPVSVNGARTIEGTDKREPFSEATKTVLIFANGAVIRLASNVAAGQLLFVTNEKTKKEVVCQVVKSKNYRTVTGYVELEFTEPAAGFWGVRIPTEAVPTSAAPKAPVAPPRPAAPAATATPAVPANVAPKGVVQAPPAPASPVPSPLAARPAIPAVPPVPAKPTVAPPAPAKPAVAPPATAPASAVVTPPSSPAPPASVSTDPNSLSAQLAAQFSALVGTEAPVASSHPAAPITAIPAAPHKPADATTEELRQQAARLQEQLSSLLFREAAAEKQAAPPAPSIQTAPPVVVPAVTPSAKPEAVHAPAVKEAAKVEVKPKPEIPVAPVKVSPVPVSVPESKSPAAAGKQSPVSLPVEEVQIPAWLAPLARETESSTESSSVAVAGATSTGEESTYKSSDQFAGELSDESSHKGQSVVLGGQLLGSSDTTGTQAAGSGSKKGLVIGLIAATVLAAGGAVWYGLQPGNFLATKAASAPAATRTAPAVVEPAVKTDAGVTTAANLGNPASSATGTTPAPSRALPNPAASVPAVDTTRNLNPVSTPDTNRTANNASRATAAPPVETPKKPVFGDVKLATPNVNRNANNANAEAAPSLEGVAAENSGIDPMAGIAASHRKEPTAPLPAGGDVKAAKLVKSVPPVYPSSARTQRVGGNVQIDALIDEAGNVTATKVISGPTMLHQAAITAVKQWKYEPAQLDGKPTAVHLTVTVQFRLQ